jgi:hypothetical protein
VSENGTPQTLDEAVLAVQAEALALDLRRDGKAEEGSARFRRYLEYPKLLRELQPLLTANSLTWQTFPTTLEERPAMRYRLKFVPTGETDEGVMLLMLDKQTSQAQGSGLTYARRQALQHVLGLTPDGDDDGAAASRPARPAPIDPEMPLGEDSVNAMLEAIAEKNLSAPKVLERAGVKEGEVPTVEQGRKVRTILDAVPS